jgi:hypothetical protein
MKMPAMKRPMDPRSTIAPCRAFDRDTIHAVRLLKKRPWRSVAHSADSDLRHLRLAVSSSLDFLTAVLIHGFGNVRFGCKQSDTSFDSIFAND